MNIPPSKAAAPTDADLAAIGQSLGALPLHTLKIILVRTCTCALRVTSTCTRARLLLPGPPDAEVAAVARAYFLPTPLATTT